jgi:hypothetical protein
MNCLHTNRRCGPCDDHCRQAAYHAGLAATTRGRGFDPIPVPSEGDGRCHAYAESAFMVCRSEVAEVRLMVQGSLPAQLLQM